MMHTLLMFKSGEFSMVIHIQFDDFSLYNVSPVMLSKKK